MNYRPIVAYAGYFMYCSMCVAEYVVQLLNAVMEELMQPTPRTSGQAPPPLCSRSSRPENQVAIDNHTKRFQQRLARVVTGIPRSCRLHFGISCVCNQGCMMILALWSRRCHGEEYLSTSGQYIGCG